MLGVRLPRGALVAVVVLLFIVAALHVASTRDQKSAEIAIKTQDDSSTSASSSSSGTSRSSAATSVPTSTQPALTSTHSNVAALPTAAPPAARRPRLTAVCMSDTHGLYQEQGLIQVPPGDLLLFAGDVEVGTAAEGLAFSHWLAGLPVRGPRVLTWGNMDTATPGLEDPIPGATVLVNTIQEVSGYRIFASPFTPRFAGAYQMDLDLEESYAYWSKLLPPNADVDIILTHGPPYGVADETRGRHRGDMGLLRAVQALQKPPLLWVCGHIHEHYGEHRVPHPRAPGGSFLLLNSAVFYLQRPGHQQAAQPRAVALPEARLLPREGAA